MAETVRERATRLIAQGNPAGLLYGAIITGAVMSATANHVPSTGRVLVAAVFVLIVYWLADITSGPSPSRSTTGDHRCPQTNLESAAGTSRVPGAARWSCPPWR